MAEPDERRCPRCIELLGDDVAARRARLLRRVVGTEPAVGPLRGVGGAARPSVRGPTDHDRIAVEGKSADGGRQIHVISLF